MVIFADKLLISLLCFAQIGYEALVSKSLSLCFTSKILV